MKQLFPTMVLVSALLAGCDAGTSPAGGAPRTLTVFAAASLSESFTDIGDAFESENPGVRVNFSFAGSQTLRTQIEEGAPADVFASANEREMDALSRSALVGRTGARLFARNRLVIIAPADNPGRLDSPMDLSRQGLKLLLAAEDVPVGIYSRRALEKMDSAFGADFSSRVLANVVSNEDNVKQVVVKMQLGEADAGIAYASDAVAAPELHRIIIPDEFNVIGRYPIGVLANSKQADLATEFVVFVLSPAGQAALAKWGFEPGGGSD